MEVDEDLNLVDGGGVLVSTLSVECCSHSSIPSEDSNKLNDHLRGEGGDRTISPFGSSTPGWCCSPCSWPWTRC